MKIFVGLGNPGKKYKGTRHNVGMMFTERLETCIKESERSNYKFIKNDKYFMNESGKIIEALGTRQLELDQLYVVHDDLDLKLGEYKIQKGVGPKVHGGIGDIERVIGKDFWRIRIGIDNRGVPRIPGEEYVLQKFLPIEINRLELVINEITRGYNNG